MTCKQLGGACDTVFSADTFEEMTKLSQTHGKEQFMKNDSAHLEAMKEMQELMQSPEEMASWMQEKKALFESL